jgi:CBS domain-containing protein
MSSRAAWRLERPGYQPVHDYVAGKVDWMAAGLPTERADRSQRRALDVADRDPSTCGPDDVIGDVLAARGAAPSVVVVNDEGIVRGRVRPNRIEDTDARVEDVMELGPATVRAHEPLDPLLQRMADRHVTEIIVTTPEGRLLGVVYRQ